MRAGHHHWMGEWILQRRVSCRACLILIGYYAGELMKHRVSTFSSFATEPGFHSIEYAKFTIKNLAWHRQPQSFSVAERWCLGRRPGICWQNSCEWKLRGTFAVIVPTELVRLWNSDTGDPIISQVRFFEKFFPQKLHAKDLLLDWHRGRMFWGHQGIQPLFNHDDNLVLGGLDLSHPTTSCYERASYSSLLGLPSRNQVEVAANQYGVQTCLSNCQMWALEYDVRLTSVPGWTCSSWSLQSCGIKSRTMIWPQTFKRAKTAWTHSSNVANLFAVHWCYVVWSIVVVPVIQTSKSVATRVIAFKWPVLVLDKMVESYKASLGI